MNDFSEILKVVGGYLDLVDGFIWGVPLLVMLLAVGVLLTIGLRGIQLSNLGRAIKLVFTPHRDEAGKVGEITSFAALCTALASTIGTEIGRAHV